MSQLKDLLVNGCLELDLTLSDQQIDSIMDYLQLLIKWNKAYNLTAIREPSQMVINHLLDSLAISPLLQSQTMVDIGSGAGLPSIPLAIANPTCQFISIETNGKKSRFQFQAKHELKLANFHWIKNRVEAVTKEDCLALTKKLPDTAICRAFSSLSQFVSCSLHLFDQGHWLAMKGVYPLEEIAQLERDFPEVKLSQSISLSIPGYIGSRHLLVLEKEGCTQTKLS